MSYQKKQLLLILTLIATIIVLAGAIFKNNILLDLGLGLIIVRLYLSLDLK